MFPLMDGDISLTPAGGRVTRRALAGAYRPPFSRLGGDLHGAILHRVATATMRALLAGVAGALASPAPTVVRQAGGSRWPVPETGALGHLLFWQDPDSFADAVTSFLLASAKINKSSLVAAPDTNDLVHDRMPGRSR